MKTFFMIVGIISSVLFACFVAMLIFVFSHEEARDAYSCASKHPDWSQSQVEKYCIDN